MNYIMMQENNFIKNEKKEILYDLIDYLEERSL